MPTPETTKRYPIDHDSQFDPIVPTRGDIEAWRQHANWAVEFNWVRPGEFNWPRAVLSLIPEWEKNNAQ